MTRQQRWAILYPFVVALLPLAMTGCPPAPQSSTQVAAYSPQPASSVVPISGPKRTIAVGRIDAIPGLAGPYTAATAGPGVAAMLTSALEQSGRFIVAERGDLSQVLTEQELVANRVAQGSAGPRPGGIIPAQYLVVGAVTELSTGDQGSGVGLGIGGLSGGGFGGLSLSGRQGTVAMDLRLVNTRTAQVEDSFTVRKELSTTGVGVVGGYNNVALGGNEFWSTPLGEAMRAALDEAVARIAADVARGGWDALVAQVTGNVLYINAGSEAGLKVGDHLAVQRVTGVLTDPATNQVLKVQKANLASVEITDVDAKFATGTFVKTSAEDPQRGDSVVFAQ